MLGSRNERPLDRYFPEVVAAVLAELPERVVLDGELVVPRLRDGRTRLDWDALSQRIHPAASRIERLAAETPAHVIAFELPRARRRRPHRTARSPSASARLEAHLPEAGAERAGRHVHLSIATTDSAVARGWFETFEGAGLDGVVGKRLAEPYRPDKRDMVKVKHHRSAEFVVVGYRRHKSIDGIGSLLLGLYDGDRLRMVGGASAFKTEERISAARAPATVCRLGADPSCDEGEKNRWNAREDSSFVPLRPELVVEVEYDQMEGDRLRHAGRLLRWRPDREPAQCTYDQLDVPARYDLDDVLAG